jgi:hypothetical protein
MTKGEFIAKLDDAYLMYLNGDVSELGMRNTLDEFEDLLYDLYKEGLPKEDISKMQCHLTEVRQNVIQNGREIVVKQPSLFAKDMRELAVLAEDYRKDDSHEIADQIMCNILRRLGYGEGVRLFEEMEKWYA